MPPKLHGRAPCLSSPTEKASTIHASCPDLQENTRKRTFRLAHAITCMLRTGLLCPPSIPVVWNRWKPFRRKACGCLSPSSSRDAFSLGILLCRVIAVTVPSHCLSCFQFFQFYSRFTSLSRFLLPLVLPATGLLISGFVHISRMRSASCSGYAYMVSRRKAGSGFQNNAIVQLAWLDSRLTHTKINT